jgi:hypothetical protein
MRLLLCRLRLALSLSVCAAPLACSTPVSIPLTAAAPPSPTVEVSVAFDDAGTLTLAPGASQPLQVTVTPPQAYDVGFELLGDSFDGSLDPATVLTGADGTAQVTLQAPTVATTFHVRASVSEVSGTVAASADLTVAVSEQGFGSVRVVPAYLGARTITSWTANIVASATCASLAGSLSEDPAGAVEGSAPVGAEPLVENLPVGPNLAVVLRAGHFAWGCTDTTMLAANKTLDVTVDVIDKPIDLAAADLDLTFSYTPDADPYTAFLADAVSQLDDAFMPDGSNEGAVVLNAMAALTPSTEIAAFDLSRQEQSWDTLAQQHFSALPQGLRATCGAWANAGAAMAPTTIVATAVGSAVGAPAPPVNTASPDVTVTVTTFAGFDPTSVGVTTAPGATWSGQPGDGVLLSANLLWQPSLFAGAASLAPAQAAHPGATSVAEALALTADCYGLATAMGAFGSCPVDCVEQLCRAAITARWAAALTASSQAATTPMVTIQASGSATVGDVAQPVTLAGHWLGQLGDGSITLAVTGNISTPTPPPTH